jgi:hypothetical protein
MSLCDLCSAPLPLGKGLTFSAPDFHKAVKAGLRPPKDVLDQMVEKRFGAEGTQYMEDRWIQQAMSDDTGWMLCPKCAADVVRILNADTAKAPEREVKPKRRLLDLFKRG